MSLHSVKERAGASAWAKIRSLLRNTVVECSAMPTDQSTYFALKQLSIGACNVDHAYYCHNCFGQAHRITNIFHTGEVWQVYTQYSLITCTPPKKNVSVLYVAINYIIRS